PTVSLWRARSRRCPMAIGIAAAEREFGDHSAEVRSGSVVTSVVPLRDDVNQIAAPGNPVCQDRSRPQTCCRSARYAKPQSVWEKAATEERVLQAAGKPDRAGRGHEL